MPARELIEYVLAATGKDTGRIAEVLLSGNLVSGASRLRWTGLTADSASLEAVLSHFPNNEPDRAFSAQRCRLIVLLGPFTRVELSRDAASRRRFLRRTSFWDCVIEQTRHSPPRYLEYSYRDSADRYRLELSLNQAAALRAGVRWLTYTTVARQIQGAALQSVDFSVSR